MEDKDKQEPADMLEASLGAEHNTKTTSSAGGAEASIWYTRNS